MTGRHEEAIPRESAMSWSELWIPASIALVVGLRWLLGERHSLYGDETST